MTDPRSIVSPGKGGTDSPMGADSLWRKAPRENRGQE